MVVGGGGGVGGNEMELDIFIEGIERKCNVQEPYHHIIGFSRSSFLE